MWYGLVDGEGFRDVIIAIYYQGYSIRQGSDGHIMMNFLA